MKKNNNFPVQSQQTGRIVRPDSKEPVNEHFTVVCDETNNTQEDIDNNRMNVGITIRPCPINEEEFKKVIADANEEISKAFGLGGFGKGGL